jgi:ABC-type sugar transport system permease subunit
MNIDVVTFLFQFVVIVVEIFAGVLMALLVHGALKGGTNR